MTATTQSDSIITFLRLLSLTQLKASLMAIVSRMSGSKHSVVQVQVLNRKKSQEFLSVISKRSTIAASKPKLELYIFINLLAVLFIPLCVEGSPREKVALFVFGDSLFDAGTNKYLNTSDSTSAPYVWPYGETFFHFPTGRISDGRIIPNFIADYMKLPFITPYLQPGSDHQFVHGSNFASGGSCVLSETSGLVVDLKTQLSQFKKVEKNLREKLGDVETKSLLSRSIYLFHTGANDYFARVVISTVLQSISRKAYIQMVIGNLTAVIKGIYESEGRKFGVLKVAQYWLTPAARARTFFSDVGAKESVEMVKLHNEALSKALKELKGNLKAFEYSVFDFYRSIGERIKSPSKYGFKEAKEACCGSGPYRGIASCGRKGFELCENVNDYIFFDASHPTDHANKQLAEQMWTGSSFTSRPTNLKTVVQIRPKVS